jgi:hypothetical protein
VIRCHEILCEFRPVPQRKPQFSITKINRLTLFKKIMAVYTENDTKRILMLCCQNANLLIVKAGGAYIYYSLLID